jgi:HSP90 family molecular chaperone
VEGFRSAVPRFVHSNSHTKSGPLSLSSSGISSSHALNFNNGHLPASVVHRVFRPASIRHWAAPITAPLSSSEASLTPSSLAKSLKDKGETFSFESNVARVMDIIINSLYSNKDVFMRELISNGADACDKKRYNLMTNQDQKLNTRPLSIRLKPDRKTNTLIIEDNGVGMNKEDLIQNLGRIAESGTKKFSDKLKSDQTNPDAAANLIGQFGVGFYSAFLVADRVAVVSRGSSGQQLRWEADYSNLGSYSIAPDEEEQTSPIESTGTRIILHLKPECDHYADEISLKALVERYSEFVPYPIE